jgi:hypothetical protein
MRMVSERVSKVRLMFDRSVFQSFFYVVKCETDCVGINKPYSEFDVHEVATKIQEGVVMERPTDCPAQM